MPYFARWWVGGLRKEFEVLVALSREEMVQNGGLGIVRIAGLVWRGRPGLLREVEQGLPNVAPQMLERLEAAGREV